jgi:hypothetical protein
MSKLNINYIIIYLIYQDLNHFYDIYRISLQLLIEIWYTYENFQSEFTNFILK